MPADLPPRISHAVAAGPVALTQHDWRAHSSSPHKHCATHPPKKNGGRSGPASVPSATKEREVVYRLALVTVADPQIPNSSPCVGRHRRPVSRAVTRPQIRPSVMRQHTDLWQRDRSRTPVLCSIRIVLDRDRGGARDLLARHGYPTQSDTAAIGSKICRRYGSARVAYLRRGPVD
jgi:hypothetical protein